MNNSKIYVGLAEQEFLQLDRGRYFLSYIIIRRNASKSAGGFYFKSFCDAIQLQPRAAKKHLTCLIERGLVEDQGNDHYRVISYKKAFGVKRNGRYFRLSDELLDSLTIRSIADWRSILNEIITEISVIRQSQKINGYTTINLRDKSVEKVRNPNLRRWDNRIATTWLAPKYGCCASTVSNYRRRQQKYSLAGYSDGGIQFVPPVSGKVGNLGAELSENDFPGKLFVFDGKLWLFKVMKRSSHFILSK
jgi:DNA-binding transcriptional ArsR family regulator